MVGKIFIMIANAFGCILYFASFGGLYISPQISVMRRLVPRVKVDGCNEEHYLSLYFEREGVCWKFVVSVKLYS